MSRAKELTLEEAKKLAAQYYKVKAEYISKDFAEFIIWLSEILKEKEK